MGIWAAVKRTLNSTLGTEEFMPLDQIIMNQFKISASDSVKQVIKAVSTSSTGVPYTSAKYNMNISGIIRLKASAVWSNGKVFDLRVYKNDALVGTLLSDWGGTSSAISGSLDISVKANDKIQIKASKEDAEYSASAVTHLEINLCGDVYLAPHKGITEVVS